MAAAVTSAHALTTTFTPSASCTINLYKLDYTDLTCEVGTSIAPCQFFHLGVDSSSSACFPSGWSDSTASYFSPGVCPAGYEQACSTVVGAETRATCCPSGYACQTATDWPWYTTDICTYTLAARQTLVYTTSILGEGEVVSTVSNQQGLNAFGLRIRYQSTDFPSSTSESSSSPTSGSSSTGGSKATNTGTTKTTNTGAAESGSSSSGGGGGGLSSGAKAGIGIGAALGALALIGALLFFFFRHRRAALAKAGGGGIPLPGGSPPAEMASEMASEMGSPAVQKSYYAASAPLHEAPGQQSWTPPVELPADGQQPQFQQPQFQQPQFQQPYQQLPQAEHSPQAEYR